MSDDQLFEWPVQQKVSRKRKTNKDAVVEQQDGNWVLLSRKGTVIGWHLKQAQNRFSAVIARCGQKGYPLTDDSTRIVKCTDCVKEAEGEL